VWSSAKVMLDCGTIKIFYTLLKAASNRLHPPRDLISLTLSNLQGYDDLHLVATIN
jgi:hypothetical protein